MLVKGIIAIFLSGLSVIAVLFASSLQDAFMPVIGLVSSGKDFGWSTTTEVIFTFVSIATTGLLQTAYALSLLALSKLRGRTETLAWFPLFGTMSLSLLDAANRFLEYRLAGVLTPIVLIATFVMVFVALFQSFRKNNLP